MSETPAEMVRRTRAEQGLPPTVPLSAVRHLVEGLRLSMRELE